MHSQPGSGSDELTAIENQTFNGGGLVVPGNAGASSHCGIATILFDNTSSTEFCADTYSISLRSTIHECAMGDHAYIWETELKLIVK